MKNRNCIMMRFLLSVSLLLLAQWQSVYAQGMRISGNVQTNANFFMTDSAIGAFGTPQYDYQKFGGETWLNLNFSNQGFEGNVRFDMFNNSNLINPTQSYNGIGIGRWFVQKKIKKLTLAGGYIYDQIGSGIIFRAYEERALAIDNALYGIKLGYQLSENWSVRAFTGKQKFRFGNYEAVIRGAAVEGFVQPDSTKQFSLVPGIGAIARTYDAETVTNIVNSLAATPSADREGLQNNTYAATLYNTLNLGRFSWYIEGAYKTQDVMDNPFAERVSGGAGRLVNQEGTVLYSNLTYAQKGLGITLEGKRTENFNFRTSPFEKAFRGQLNFLPPLARQNTYRLTTRYVPAVQEFGEQSFQVDIKYAVTKKWRLALNSSRITDLSNRLLYQEIYPEIVFKQGKKWQALAGVQVQYYNQAIFENKNDIVKTVVPFGEFFYKLSPKRSVRVETQYLHTKDDFGSWLNGLVEVGFAPHWIIYASDMYKLKHEAGATTSRGKPVTLDNTRLDGLHYPSVGCVYTTGPNRFALAYVKQVEGINCAGGICRYEPTFHGVRLNVNSNF
jgi:Family of unknown function (DUF6029)